MESSESTQKHHFQEASLSKQAYIHTVQNDTTFTTTIRFPSLSIFQPVLHSFIMDMMEILPAEIRQIIFSHCVKNRACGFLYTNKKYHAEFAPLVSEKFVLGFHIDPAASSTVVKLVNPDNTPWGEHCTFDAGSPHAKWRVLRSMPIDKFKEIRIIVDAPNTSDPGQLVRGWLQCNALVKALLPEWRFGKYIAPTRERDFRLPTARSSKRLPPITIEVRDTTAAKWHANNSWNSSISSFYLDHDLTDVEVVLTPLARIRHAKFMTIILPRGAPRLEIVPDKVTLANFLNILVQISVKRISFPLDRQDGGGNDDSTILAQEDALHLRLDYKLDDLDGPTAALLRRDRFKFWCSEYEYQLRRHAFGLGGANPALGGSVIGGSMDVMGAQTVAAIQLTFHDRFMSRLKHIVAVRRDILRRNGQPVHTSPYLAYEYESLDNELLKLGLPRPSALQDENFWETWYPNGIERKSRNDKWDDTSSVLMIHGVRLGFPIGSRGETASQIFNPSFSAPCSHCERGRLRMLSVFRRNTARRSLIYSLDVRTIVRRILLPIRAS